MLGSHCYVCSGCHSVWTGARGPPLLGCPGHFNLADTTSIRRRSTVFDYIICMTGTVDTSPAYSILFSFFKFEKKLKKNHNFLHSQWEGNKSNHQVNPYLFQKLRQKKCTLKYNWGVNKNTQTKKSQFFFLKKANTMLHVCLWGFFIVIISVILHFTVCECAEDHRFFCLSLLYEIIHCAKLTLSASFSRVYLPL